MTGADLLARILPRMANAGGSPGISFESALNTAVGIVFNILHRRRSELIRAQFTGVTVGGEFTALPMEFRGLVSERLRLVKDGIDYLLSELPLGLDAGTSGDPAYYRLSGTKQIQVLPIPVTSYTLTGWYYSHPGTIGLASTLPWDGLLDGEIEEAVVMVLAGGGIVTRPIRDTIAESVDEAISPRTITPRRNRCW